MNVFIAIVYAVGALCFFVGSLLNLALQMKLIE